MTKQIFKPKKLERFTLEQYNGDIKNDLKDSIKDGLLIRTFTGQPTIWNEHAGTWQQIDSGQYVEQLPDGTFNRRSSAEVNEDLELA